MHDKKHLSALEEVNSYIDESLKSRDLLKRQRLLMAALSLGMQHVIELWLHKEHAIKPGATIKHEFFKSEERRLKIRLMGMLTKKIDDVRNADAILEIAREIERDRDDIVYGAPLSGDKALREKIELFFELKKTVKNSVGEFE